MHKINTMFAELLLISLLAIILVRVLASIKLATERAVTFWTTSNVVNATQLRRSVRIQNQSKRNVSPQLMRRREERLRNA